MLDEIRERIPKLDEGQIEYNNTIRFDLCLSAPFPFDSPQQLWIDHGIVHETSESYQESMVQHLESGLAALSGEPFRRMESSKDRRFKSLINIAKHLQKQRLLDFQPSFLPGSLGAWLPECRRTELDEVYEYGLQPDDG